MIDNTELDISLLNLSDAPRLAPLVAAYVQAMHRGAPRRPDQLFVERLLQDKNAEFLGALINGDLVGFLMFCDLPDISSGMRLGQADHVYVHHEHRGKGIAKALVDVLADQAEERGWTRLKLNAPRTSETGKKVFETVAAPADWNSYVLVF